jgi:hypothetical protein
LAYSSENYLAQIKNANKSSDNAASEGLKNDLQTFVAGLIEA